MGELEALTSMVALGEAGLLLVFVEVVEMKAVRAAMALSTELRLWRRPIISRAGPLGGLALLKIFSLLPVMRVSKWLW
jgi:hypothetical protein